MDWEFIDDDGHDEEKKKEDVNERDSEYNE